MLTSVFRVLFKQLKTLNFTSVWLVFSKLFFSVTPYTMPLWHLLGWGIIAFTGFLNQMTKLLKNINESYGTIFRIL